jgi:hypothetical protein
MTEHLLGKQGLELAVGHEQRLVVLHDQQVLLAKQECCNSQLACAKSKFSLKEMCETSSTDLR